MAYHLINYRALLTSDAGGQNAAAGVEITVRVMSDSSVADLFSDPGGTIGIDNPYTTNAEGRHPDVAGYYVETGREYGIYNGAQLLVKVPVVATVAMTGNYSDLNGLPTLAIVATTGDYNDLINTPADINESLGRKEVLRMDFAANEYLILEDYGNEPKQLSNIAGFVRNSLAGVFNGRKQWVNRAINTPRIAYDPVTGMCLGYLSEQSVTNFLTYSENLSDSSWTKARSTFLSNLAVSPRGDLTAGKLIEDTSASNTHYIRKSHSFVSGTAYTFSFYAKAAELTQLAATLPAAAFSGADQRVLFDLTAKTSVIQNGAPTHKLEDSGGGWFRCIVTAVASATTSDAVFVYTAKSNTVTYTGDGTSGIHVWGTQLETGLVATSYIPTAAATVTRAADLLTVSGAEFAKFWNPTEGSIYCEFVMPATTGTVKRIFTVSDGTVNNRISLSQVSGNQNLYVVYKVANVGADSAVISIAAGSVVKVAYLYTATRQDFYVNGALVGFTTNAGSPVVNTMHVGANQVGTDQPITTIAKIRYFNTPLSAGEAATLTGV